MQARVTTLEGSPEKMDDATRHVQQQVLPQLQQMDGFRGFVGLGDRQSGKLVGVALWEDEEALRATEEAVSSVRSEAAEAAEGSVAGVEHYEVVVFEVPSGGPVGAVTDTVGWTTGSGGPVGAVTDTVGWTTGSAREDTDNLSGGGEEEKQS